MLFMPGGVTRGLAASAMPSFGDLLTEAEIAGVVEQVKRLARLHSVPASGIVPQRMSRVRPNIARGRDLYAGLGCVGCHGADGRKTGFLQDARGYHTPVRDLTAPWTFRGGSAPTFDLG